MRQGVGSWDKVRGAAALGALRRVGILCPCNVHRVCSRHEGPCSSENKQPSSYKQWQPSPLTGRAPAARSGYKCTGPLSCHVSCLNAARMQIASHRAHQVPGSAEHTLLASSKLQLTSRRDGCWPAIAGWQFDQRPQHRSCVDSAAEQPCIAAFEHSHASGHGLRDLLQSPENWAASLFWSCACRVALQGHPHRCSRSVRTCMELSLAC